jgi:hypothetical protein
MEQICKKTQFPKKHTLHCKRYHIDRTQIRLNKYRSRRSINRVGTMSRMVRLNLTEDYNED